MRGNGMRCLDKPRHAQTNSTHSLRVVLILICALWLVACNSDGKDGDAKNAADKVADAVAEAVYVVPQKIVEKQTGKVFDALDEAQENNLKRAEERAAKAKHEARLKAIKGCTANAKRTKCSCFDENGSKETVLNHEQCIAVVERGLAALHDF